jgi:hypothetical protein
MRQENPTKVHNPTNLPDFIPTAHTNRDSFWYNRFDMTREEIISAAARIAEIRLELSRLSALQKELRQLELRIDGVADSPAPQVPIRSRAKGETLMDKAVRVVDSEPGREWTAEEINEVLRANLASVASALSKAKGNNLLTKCGRGRFGSNTNSAPTEASNTEVDQTKAA